MFENRHGFLLLTGIPPQLVIF